MSSPHPDQTWSPNGAAALAGNTTGEQWGSSAVDPAHVGDQPISNHVSTVSPWHAAHFDDAEAHEWYDAGFGAEQAGLWADQGFVPAVALAWADQGFEPSTARTWCAGGYFPVEARTWMAAPAAAAAKIRVLPNRVDGDGHPPVTGLTPDEALGGLMLEHRYGGEPNSNRLRTAEYSHDAAIFLGSSVNDAAEMPVRTHREVYAEFGFHPRQTVEWARFEIPPHQAGIADELDISPIAMYDLLDPTTGVAAITPAIATEIQLRNVAYEGYGSLIDILIEALSPPPGMPPESLNESKELLRYLRMCYAELFPDDVNIFDSAADHLGIDDDGTRTAADRDLARDALRSADELLHKAVYSPSGWATQRLGTQ